MGTEKTWCGRVDCTAGAGDVCKCTEPCQDSLSHKVERKRGPGRPKMTWKQLTERNCREWKLSAINPHDRYMWRSGLRSAMCAASQLSGRGPIDVDVAPVVFLCLVNK